MARDIEATCGVPAAWGAHGSTPFAIPLDGSTLLPARQGPIHPDEWVAVALEQKLTKYGPVENLRWIVHSRRQIAICARNASRRTEIVAQRVSARDIAAREAEIRCVTEGTHASQ